VDHQTTALRSVSGRNWYVNCVTAHRENSVLATKTKRALLKRKRIDERRGELGLMYICLVFFGMLAITSRAWFPVFKEVSSRLQEPGISN
jgi:hypothetical protein